MPIPNRTTVELNFGRLGRRRLEANFEGGKLSSDGDLTLLRQNDACTGLSRMAARALNERRAPRRIRHRLRDVLAQRLCGLCCGYEDLNDHAYLSSHCQGSSRFPPAGVELTHRHTFRANA